MPLALGLLAVYHLALGLFMVVAPGAFYDGFGPFPPENHHYIRDAAGAMQGSLGVAMGIAIFRRSWRVGVLGYAVLHFAFHGINHLVDIGDADPERMGPIDFATIGLTAVLLGWLLRKLLGERREPVR